MWWKTTVHKKETKWFAKTRMLGNNKNYIKARYWGTIYERDKTFRYQAETLDKTCQRRSIPRPSGLGVIAMVMPSNLDTTYIQQTHRVNISQSSIRLCCNNPSNACDLCLLKHHQVVFQSRIFFYLVLFLKLFV